MRAPVSMKTVLMCLALVLTPVVAQAKPVWIDVRTEAEHQQSHIDGDPLIPHSNIVAQVTGLFPDKDTEIHLYCRSGNRAGKAKSALESAGYTNVKNRGSVAEAREARDLQCLAYADVRGNFPRIYQGKYATLKAEGVTGFRHLLRPAFRFIQNLTISR